MMIPTEYRFKAVVWLYPGMAGWHFATAPQAISDEIKSGFAGMGRGWGSLPVTAMVGDTRWETSLFPDKKLDAYLLPLKADIRRKAGIKEGDEIALTVTIRT